MVRNLVFSSSPCLSLVNGVFVFVGTTGWVMDLKTKWLIFNL